MWLLSVYKTLTYRKYDSCCSVFCWSKHSASELQSPLLRLFILYYQQTAVYSADAEATAAWRCTRRVTQSRLLDSGGYSAYDSHSYSAPSYDHYAAISVSSASKKATLAAVTAQLSCVVPSLHRQNPDDRAQIGALSTAVGTPLR